MAKQVVVTSSSHFANWGLPDVYLPCDSVGLVHITGKKAAKIAHDTLTVLKRYGFT